MDAALRRTRGLVVIPSLPIIVAARILLDDALIESREIAHEDLPAEPVAEALSEALRNVYVSLASLGDARVFHEAREVAITHVREALARLQTISGEDPVVDSVAQTAARALRLLLQAPLPILNPPPALPRANDPRPAVVATFDEPRLLDLRRDVLRPMVPLPDRPDSEAPERVTEVPPEPCTDLDALREETLAALRAIDADDDAEDEAPPPPPPAPWDPERLEKSAFGEQHTAMDVLFDRARNCLEDLGAFGLSRRPTEDETWWCPRTEARLLTRIDALASVGEAVTPWLVRLLEERPVPDPEITWATLLFFGCVAGDDALDQVMRVARVTPLEEPELRASLADALSHAPHPGISMAFRPWLGDASPGRREVALRALGRRGALSVTEMVPLAYDADPAVARAALEALAAGADEVPAEVLSHALSHADDAVLAAAFDLASMRAPDLALRRATELTLAGDGHRGEAAMHVAINADAQGLATLHGAGALTALRCEALGWYGHAASVGALIHALTLDDALAVARAAEALWRITGAAVTDDEPLPEPDLKAFRGDTWEGDELPDAPAELSVDPALWAALWDARGAGADHATRWRFGRRWRVEDNVRLLASKSSRPRERRWAALELAARTGRRQPFEAWRFIPRQSAQIEAWRESLARRAPQGSWPVQWETR